MFVKNANEKELAEVVASSKEPALIDFSAEAWCAPCRAIAPTLEKVAEERIGNLSVLKIDIDNNPSVAQTFRVSGVPTLVLMVNGREVSRKTGALSKASLDSWIDSELGGRKEA